MIKELGSRRAGGRARRRGTRACQGFGLGSVAGAGGGAMAATGVVVVLAAVPIWRSMLGGADAPLAVLVALLFGCPVGSVAGAVAGLVLGALEVERVAPAVGAASSVAVGWGMAGDLVAGTNGAVAVILVVLGAVGWVTGCWFRRAMADAGEPAPHPPDR